MADLGEFRLPAEHSADAESTDGRAAPIHWPSLDAEQAQVEWESLWIWVDDLRRRFPYALRLPTCWWRHNDVVEALAGLRDYEKYAFSGIAYGAGGVDWQRAMRDTESRLDAWVKRFSCSVSDRDHQVVKACQPPEEWRTFVSEDVAGRRERPDARPCAEQSYGPEV